MGKRLCLSFICLMFLGMASGCTTGQTPEDWMKPPKLEGRKEQVKLALEEYLPKNAKLVIPPSIGKPSAIKFLDLDGDEQEEVIIFYNLELEESPLRALVLKNENREWINKGEIKILGHDLDKVIFKDIDGSRGLDIIIGSRIRYSLEKSLNIYSFRDGNISEVFESDYEDIVIEDLNEDGLSEIIVLKSDKEIDEFWVELYKYRYGIVEIKDKINLENISQFNAIKDGYIDLDTKGVIIRATSINQLLNTYILTVRQDRFINVIKQGVIESEKVPNIENIEPKDIDKDGILEFAIPNIQKISNRSIQQSMNWITEWYSWDSVESINLKKINYYDKNLRFSFDIPLKWRKNINIINSKRDNNIRSNEEWVRVEYKEYKADKEVKRHHLFTIYIYTDEGLRRTNTSKIESSSIKTLDYMDKNYFLVLSDSIDKEIDKEISIEVEKIVESFEILER